MRAFASSTSFMKFAGMLMLSLVAMLLVHQGSASAYGVTRSPYNAIESDRKAQCDIQVYKAYGAGWINGTSLSMLGRATPNIPRGPGDARWSEAPVSVAWDATSVDVSLWTTAYVCSDGSDQTNIKITDLQNAGSTVPISSFASTAIQRGSASPGKWTDYPGPGGIRITLNLGNVMKDYGTNCYTVSFSGTYSSDQSPGRSGTYDSRVCINRASPPASLVGYKIDDSGTGASPAAIAGRTVTVSGVGSRSTNPFSFTNVIPAGTHTVSTSAPSGWMVIGYTICRTDRAGCTSSYLNNPRNMTPSSGTLRNASFTAGKTYHMRWIFQQIPPPECSGQTFPSTMVVGREYQFTVKMSVSVWPINPAPVMYVRVVGPDGSTVYNNANQPYTQSSLTLTSSPIKITPDMRGTYRMTWGISSPWAIPCGSIPGDAGNQPYLTVNGGDTIAGPDGIYGYNENSGGYSGAGAQLAALSSGDIVGFVTGKGLPSIGSGYSLGFANVPAPGPGSGNYGGKFGVLPAMSSIPFGLKVDYPNFNGNLSSVTQSGVYQLAPSATLYGTVDGKAYPGLDITILATSGDVIVSDNITYNYDSLNSVPRLNVYTQDGNIIFRGNVTVAHGVFIAENSSGAATKGLIYTCGVAANGIDYTELSANGASCVSRLTIYGSVTASNIILGRISGTWVPSQPDTKPSEIIQYSPEVWMHRTNKSSGKFDSYVSLPPVL